MRPRKPKPAPPPTPLETAIVHACDHQKTIDALCANLDRVAARLVLKTEEHDKIATELGTTWQECNEGRRQLVLLAVHDIDRSLTLGVMLSRPTFLLQLKPGGTLKFGPLPTDDEIGAAVHKGFDGWNWADCPDDAKRRYIAAGKAARAL